MSKHQSDRKEDIQSAGQTDRVTERQNDSMADSRAAKEPALVCLDMSVITAHMGPELKKSDINGSGEIILGCSYSWIIPQTK